MKSSMVLFEVLLENICFPCLIILFDKRSKAMFWAIFYDQLRYAMYSFIGLFMKAILRKIPLFFFGHSKYFLLSQKRKFYQNLFSEKLRQHIPISPRFLESFAFLFWVRHKQNWFSRATFYA